MENKHFIIFIGIILIVLMLFSLNKEDSNQTAVEQTDNDSTVLNDEQKYAPVNNSYNSSNESSESENTAKEHMSITNYNSNEPR